MRLLHLADLHLGWAPRDLPVALAEARQTARDARLDEAVAVALAERVDAVLIVGDLFERFDPPAELVRQARAALERLVAGGIAVVTVPGNHDELTYPDSVYRREGDRWPGVLVREPMPAHVTTFEAGGETLHVHALAYVGGVTTVRDALAQLPPRDAPGRHVFLAHGTLVHAVDAVADERSLPLPRAALAAAGYDYVALGHLHRPSEQRLGTSLALYPGCVGGKGFDDPGAEAWTLVSLTPQGVEVERRAHGGQRLRDLELDVSAFDDEAGLEEALTALLAPAVGDLVRVRLTGAAACDVDVERLTDRCRGDAAYLRVEDRTSAVSEALLELWGASPTVRGTFVRRVRQRIDAAGDPEERARLVRALRLGLDAMAATR